jgi:hypothetical protein
MQEAARAELARNSLLVGWAPLEGMQEEQEHSHKKVSALKQPSLPAYAF